MTQKGQKQTKFRGPGRVPPAARFWAKVVKGPECWEWQASRSYAGYGRVNLGGEYLGAHRVSWEMANGPIPEGMHVCHRCDNPPCVNPAHLFVATQQQNNQDMVDKGRHRPRGYVPKRLRNG